MPRGHESKHRITEEHREHRHHHDDRDRSHASRATSAKPPKQSLSLEQVLATRSSSTLQAAPTEIHVAASEATAPASFFSSVRAETTTVVNVNKEFDDLAADMIKFPESYDERRKQLDDKRFFGTYRATTKTPARRAAAEFIKTMAQLIQSKRTIIEAQDPSLLVNALSGVLLVELKKINESYLEAFAVTRLLTSIKNSALASIIFDILKVDSLDKIKPAKFNADLESLKKCLTIINKEQKLEDKAILDFIGDLDKFLESARTAEPEAAPAAAI